MVNIDFRLTLNILMYLQQFVHMTTGSSFQLIDCELCRITEFDLYVLIYQHVHLIFNIHGHILYLK